MKEIKKDMHHIISIMLATVVVVFLLLRIEPYNEMLEFLVYIYTMIMGPIVIYYSFFKMLDYEDGHVYIMFFALSIIGFLGNFVENETIFRLSLIPWACAFVYFPTMKYIKFTKKWFEKIDEKNIHLSKRKKVEKMAKKKYKRKVSVKVIENDGKKACLAIVSPHKNPNYLIAEWEVEFKRGKIVVREDRWIGERFKK